MKLALRMTRWTPPLMIALAVPAALHGQGAPPQAPVVAPGDAAVDASRIKLGKFTFKVTGKMNDQEVDLGTMTQEITATTFNGNAVIRTVQTSTGRMGVNADSSIVSATSLIPVQLRGHNPGGSLTVNFAGTKVTGEKKDHEGSAQAIDQTLAQPVFDSNIVDIVAAALPLQAGYAARVPVFIYEQGGLVWYDVKVTGERVVNSVAAWDVTITMPSGSVRYEFAKSDRANLGAEYTAGSGMKVIMTPTGG